MKDIVITRLMRFKKQALSLSFWLLFPLLMTLLVVYGFEQMKTDVNVPVGVVADESSVETDGLMEEMKKTEFIRLVETEEAAAKNQLEKHQLDSVFKVSPDFSDDIAEGRHRHLLDSYHSNQSFAYVPVKEMVISYVQEDFYRSRAAKVLDRLSAKYGEEGKWSREEIINTSKEIQQEQDLLDVSLQMSGEPSNNDDSAMPLDIWAIWASFTLLATLLLFDWIIQERHAGVRPRFAFMRYSFKHYLLLNGVLYLMLSLVLNAVTMVLFEAVLQKTISMGTMFAFQLTISLGAFLLAHLFKRAFAYYMVSFAITLVIAVGSGTILPNQGLIQQFPWLMQLNPLQPFLEDGYVNLFSIVVVGGALFWYLKRGTSRVTS